MKNAEQRSKVCSRQKAANKKELIAAKGVNLLFVTFLIGKSEDIIHRNAVETRKLDEYFRRNVKLSSLIIAVYALTARKNFCNLLLSHVLVFAQVADSLIHNYHRIYYM